MVRAFQTQFSLNGGIYGPALAERDDTEGYYASVRDMLNMRPLPEGGAEARNGYAFCNTMRGPLSQIDLTGVTFTANASASLDGSGDTLPDPGGGSDDPPAYPGEDTPPDPDEFLP